MGDTSMTDAAPPAGGVPWSDPGPLAVTSINATRVAIGGAIAGIVHFVIIGLLNGVILGGEFQAWMLQSGSFVHPAPIAISIALWALMSLTYGVVGVWLCAAIRPRYGAGARAAVLCGLALWVVSKLTVALDFITLGAIPTGIIAGQAFGGLVAIVIAVLVGSWFYKE
jgi:hypothetical protein